MARVPGICSLCKDKDYPPCTVFSIPTFNNKPKYHKFYNFLRQDIVGEKKYLTCEEACPDSLILDEVGLKLNSENCIGVGLCLINCPFGVLEFNSNFSVQQGPLSEDERAELRRKVGCFFNGNPFPVPEKIVGGRRISLETYTAEKETKHLSTWAASVLKFLSGDSHSYVGLEIEILRAKKPRDGRIDVCARSGDDVLIVESKVSLEKAVTEGSFHIQMKGYLEESEKFISKYNKLFDASLRRYAILLIGGRESDLLPPGHKSNTGVVGGYNKRFYEIVEREKIKFVSATALWCLLVWSVVAGRKLHWDLVCEDVLFKKNVFGLLSGGIVAKERDKFLLKSVTPEKIDSIVRDAS